MLIDEEDGIIAGHGRVLGAHLLGLDEVPCIVLAPLRISALTGFALSALGALCGAMVVAEALLSS